MHRTWGLIALVMCTVLVGCTAAPNIDYRATLPSETTRTSGLSETTLTPVAFKAAPKNDTPIASATSDAGMTGGGSAGSSSSGSGYIAQVFSSPSSGCLSTGNVALIAKVYTSDTRRPVVATVYVTCTYKCGGSSQSKTYTIKTNLSGASSKVVDATPYDVPTKVTISGYAMVAGTRVKLSASGYSTN